MTRHRAEPDPDAPLSDAEFERGRTALLARRARAATGLSQEAFAARYGFALACIRDWEQGRRRPDTAARSYLRVISAIPDAVADAMKRAG
ncbi:helix-turn-helix domain-containing protein [Amorphus coralli]|uniref:helix-turn-helix domain-containing protein n=1 Tax=Amorphus coralli TaxID=340680 RepID=UPI00035F270F|nr:helix-turn-helix domain-containing protein [Amorphus coralli]